MNVQSTFGKLVARQASAFNVQSPVFKAVILNEAKNLKTEMFRFA
jgi:hypothetical protein